MDRVHLGISDVQIAALCFLAASPWQGMAVVDDAGIVIGARGYCSLDDPQGTVVLEITENERARLVEHGFELPMEQYGVDGGRWCVREAASSK